MKRPEEVQLSREEGEALIERLERNTLSAEDRRLLVKILTFYFWLLFALREAKLSLKRLKALVFGEKPKKPKPLASGGTPNAGSAAGRRYQQEPPRADKQPLGQKQLRRSRMRLGMGDRGPRCIAGHRRWPVGTRSERWASGVRPVGAGACSGCHPAWRCDSTATPYSRPCGMRWRSCAAQPVGKSLPPLFQRQPARRSIRRGPGRG